MTPSERGSRIAGIIGGSGSRRRGPRPSPSIRCRRSNHPDALDLADGETGSGPASPERPSEAIPAIFMRSRRPGIMRLTAGVYAIGMAELVRYDGNSRSFVPYLDEIIGF
jgi:hypothetical protein